MTDLDRRFHETWLGMVQPVEGLVVSIPVLVDAQCMERQSPQVQQKLVELCPPRTFTEAGDEKYTIADLPRFLDDLLGHAPASFDAGDALPDDLALYVPEGQQTLRPTFALRKLVPPPAAETADATPATRAGAAYEMLVWQLPDGLDLDRAETVTGSWDYPPSAKFDRLLRHCRVAIGLLTNGNHVRLVYAPHGESSGAITFRLDDMASVGGRPILDAFVMLLSANRFFGVEEARALPAILAESRKRQANVTNDLAEQVFEALQILLRGFEAAAERDGRDLLDDAVARTDDHLYSGLLTVLLRLVFVLYAEDRALLPVEQPLYAEHFSVLALFASLQRDRDAWPDSMSRRFGAWGRMIALFRAVFLGVDHGALHTPPRRGTLFDPHRFPFLEGWGPAGSAPIVEDGARAAVRVPTLDDETVFRVLEKLLVLDGQRLSYRALDVEQIGSVYEALMGYHVVRLGHDAVALRVKAKSGAARAWVELPGLLGEPAARRGAWLEDQLGFDKATARKVGEAVKGFLAGDAAKGVEALLDVAAGRTKDRTAFLARAGRLVLQPGPERRRTSSHYTPRELSGPIVRRTLEPLIAVMGEAPESKRILDLKVCDPAMGSGAFLVEACRFLGDEVVKAWQREGETPPGEDPTLAARRLVAQRCLYGVDKNAYAVDLAKLSVWLVTLARELPFTFLDHALRHGDSLVGLDFDQIRAGHWRPSKQLSIAEVTLREALDEAIELRREILRLAADPTPSAQREKERKLTDADDALAHARLLGDLGIGAFFAHENDRSREKERISRIDKFVTWRQTDEGSIPSELVIWQREIRDKIPVFHWMLEFPEIFYSERADPLDCERVNRVALMDAFVGNPPFAGKNGIVESGGECFNDWLMTRHPDVLGRPNTDLCAYFFRMAATFLGRNGSCGFIATNTISQGDTRLMGIKKLIDDGAIISDAISSRPWPGDAAVNFAVVNLLFGTVKNIERVRTLDDRWVKTISSRLKDSPERADPELLAPNLNIAFMGGKLVGDGLAVSKESYRELVGSHPQNASVLRPYVGGEDVNTDPEGKHSRYVIDFTPYSLQEAQSSSGRGFARH